MSTFIVRISPNNKIALRDWNNLIHDNNRYVTWDKDYKNKIHKGDTIGFIVGEVVSPRIYFYDVFAELSNQSRNSSWSNTIYTHSQNVNHDITTREVIVLDTHTLREHDYNEYKRRVGYKENYIPRGTTRARPLPS